MPSGGSGRAPTRLGQNLRVSPYEKVASWFLALVMMIGFMTVVLFLIWLSTKVFVPTLPVAVALPDESDFGGYENGVLGESMQIDGPTTEEIAQESDLPTEPAIEKVMEAMVDAVATIPVDLADPTLTEEVESGGVGGSEGDGNAPALGEGGGKGGVRRGQRWIIRYQEGGTLENYGRQLDFFGVELGALGGSDQVQYASNLASPTPASRTGPPDQEQRLYFSWQSGSLQQSDRDLLARAGINTSGKVIVQFYPQNTENTMAQLEMDYLQRRFPGRDLRQVRRTYFTVQSEGQGYKFVITDQTYF
jgi:hypothetical protein